MEASKSQACAFKVDCQFDSIRNTNTIRYDAIKSNNNDAASLYITSTISYFLQ